MAQLLGTQPPITLATEHDLRHALENPHEWNSAETRYKVRCEWLIALIRELKGIKRASGAKKVTEKTEGGVIETTINLGYDTVYNSEVVLEAQRRLGLPEDEQDRNMGALVYASQDWARTDELAEQGYVLATAEMLEEALQRNQKIMSADWHEPLRLKRLGNGEIGGFKPRVTSRYLPLIGTPIIAP